MLLLEVDSHLVWERLIIISDIMSTKEEAIEKKHKFIIDSVKTFGLYIDLDNWEEKGWIRIESLNHKDLKPLIIYQDETEETILNEFRNYMYSIGAYILKERFKGLFDL
jgi:hypothetical protein